MWSKLGICDKIGVLGVGGHTIIYSRKERLGKNFKL